VGIKFRFYSTRLTIVSYSLLNFFICKKVFLSLLFLWVITVWSLVFTPVSTCAQVDNFQKISATSGGLTGVEFDDRFGTSVAPLGDLDGDSVPDLAVGVRFDDDGNSSNGDANRGAIQILYLNADGTVASQEKISDTAGGFGGTLDDRDYFGEDVAKIGDLNGDSVPELAVGTPRDDDGASDAGALWNLFGSNALLPVELASFEATVSGKTVILDWVTVSETNNTGFNVQHRTVSQENWNRLGFVEGAGTTSEPQSYRFKTKENLGPGTHRLRLRQIDTDGTEYFSKTVTVRIKIQQKVRLSAPAPNPIDEGATLNLVVKEPKETTVTLYNLLGQQVVTLYEGQPASKEQIRINLDASELSSGTYLIRLQTGRMSKMQTVTVVK